MDYTRLGSTDITIPRLCIGGMSFGKVFPDFHQWVIDQEATQAVIARALELGVTFIDTANVYAHGTSEEFIGASLKNLGVPRADVVLASKVYFNEGHLSRAAIEREIDGTLGRLGTDYLDLYIIHRFDYATPVEETMEALDSLVRSGRVRALGASAMYAYQLHTMQVTADAHGWTRFSSMQNHYNLLYREDEREMIPVCRQYGMALTPYSPLASGHLGLRRRALHHRRHHARQVRPRARDRHAHHRARRRARRALRGGDGGRRTRLALGQGGGRPHRRLLAAEPRRRRRSGSRPDAHRGGRRLPRGALPGP